MKRFGIIPTTYNGPGGFYVVRVHSATPAAYTLLDTDPNGNPLRRGSRAKKP